VARFAPFGDNRRPRVMREKEQLVMSFTGLRFVLTFAITLNTIVVSPLNFVVAVQQQRKQKQKQKSIIKHTACVIIVNYGSLRGLF
jgi:hypothetical protein